MSNLAFDDLGVNDGLVLRLSGENYQGGDQWQDLSGKNYHATVAANCTMPTQLAVEGYNGRSFKVMRFATNSGMILPDALNLQKPYTVMIIDRYYGTIKGRTLQSRDNNWLLGKWAGHNGCFMEGWLGYHPAETGTFTVNAATLKETQCAWYKDGTLQRDAGGITAPGRLGLCKGGRYSNEVSEADVAAVLIWDRVLSENERLRVEGWLGEQYGLAVSQAALAAYDCHSLKKKVGGKALTLDGAGDYLEVPYTSQLNPEQFTVSCWLKVEGGSGHRSPVTSRAEPQKGYLIYVSPDNTLAFWTGRGSGWNYLNGPKIVSDTWTHLAVTYDGNEGKLYVNGKLKAQQAMTYAPNPDRPFRIGAGTTEGVAKYFLPGQISEVNIWSKVRTESEIQTDMYRSLTGSEEGLAGYWPFSDGTAKDYSVNNNDGTLYGNSAVVSADIPNFNKTVLPFEELGIGKGLSLHLSGDDYQAGDQWNDLSGSNYHAEVAPNCTMPTQHNVEGYNGRDFGVMRFSKTGGMILSDSLNLQKPYTVMIVDRYYGTVRGRTLQSRDNNWLLGKWSGHNGCFMEGWLGYHSAETGTFTVNTATLAGTQCAWYKDGTLQRDFGGITAPGKLGLCKGGRYSNEVSEADVAAVLIWDRVLSESERQRVEGWLGAKYGIPVSDQAQATYDCYCLEQVNSKRNPNILFVITDDLGTDVLKFIDDKAIAQAPGTKKYTLPTLSKLLESGVNFTRTWAHPVCSPSRATMFTGMHPWQNEVGFASFVVNPAVGAPFIEADKPDPLPGRQDTAVYEIPLKYEGQKVETYADTLKEAGYTCGFFGKWDQGYMLTKNGQTERDKNGPIDRGWDRFEGVMGGGVDPRASSTGDLDPKLYWTWVKEIQDVNEKENDLIIQKFQKSPEANAVDWNYPMTLRTDDTNKTEGTRQHAYATADSVYSARDWIKENADTPWCATLALHAPHYPYHVPPAGTYTIDEFKPIIIEEKENPLPPTIVSPTTRQIIPNPEYVNYTKYLGLIGREPEYGNDNTSVQVQKERLEPGTPEYSAYLDVYSEAEEQVKFVAMIQSMDHYLSELLNDVDIQNEIKNTVIIFVGDNGSPSSVVDLDNDLIKEGKRSVYMPGVNVPMVVADGSAVLDRTPFYLDQDDLGADSYAMAQVADLFQTITDIGQGVRTSNYNLDSFSLLPYLNDTTADTRQYNFGQYFVNIRGTGPLTNRASITDGQYKLNYQGDGEDIKPLVPEGEEYEHKEYEFAELMVDPETGLQTERYLNDFSHPKAIELHKVLQEQFRASSGEVVPDKKSLFIPPSNLPETFPDLPESRALIHISASATAIQQQGSLALIKPDVLKVGGPKNTRGKVLFDVSNVSKSIKKATLYLKSFDLETTEVGVEPLLNSTQLYPETATDTSKRVTTQMSGEARYEHDVTEIVQGWLNNPASNFGFRILSTDGSEAVFYNHYNTVFGPTLEIEAN